jgi:hypothetical protein
MSKAHQYIIKAAALRAQADKLEKVAVLVDQDVDSGSGSMSTAAKVGLGLGAGALGLGALGGAGALGFSAGGVRGLATGGALATKHLALQRARDLKAVRNAALKPALIWGGALGAIPLIFGAHPILTGIGALLGAAGGGMSGYSLATLRNNIKDYKALKKAGLW